jgi:trehalose 6-phosphate synthase/phosphatase
MNLVAKEFVATRTDGTGVLILSEMAGSANEMHEALLINPNDFDQIAGALDQAIKMPEDAQKARNRPMQKRLERYNVERWANDFMDALKSQQNRDYSLVASRLDVDLTNTLLEQYREAGSRILFIDYDGTLAGFKNDPQEARPDKQVMQLLDDLHGQNHTDVFLISGRDKETFTRWFKGKEYAKIVEHGVWISEAGEPFKMLENVKNDWMEKVRRVLESFVDRTPGSFIEDKNYSLAWHYRNTDPDFGQKRATELNTVLRSLIANDDLSVLNGNKVVEIKSSNVNKGRAAMQMVSRKAYDFIFAIGDDWTDEFMFQELPEGAVTVKVGRMKTQARFYVDGIKAVRDLLKRFAEIR